MKKTIRMVFCVACVCVALAPLVRADSFKPAEVSADARWAVHLDVALLLESRIGKHILGMVEDGGDLKEINAFGAECDFDLFEDLHSVTVYGKGFEEEEAVVLVKGRFNKDKVLEMVRKEGGNLGEVEYGEFTIYTSEDSHEDMNLCFCGKNAAVLSNNRSLTKEALDVLFGKRESLADEGKLKEMRSLPEGTYFAAAARGFDKIVDEEPQAAVLKKAESVVLAAGEMEGEFFAKATLATRDEETAGQVHNILQGLFSLGMMLEGMEEGEPELGELLRLVKSVKFNVKGRSVSLHISKPAEDLIEILKGMNGD